MIAATVRPATLEDLMVLQKIEDEADELFASVFSRVYWRPAPSGVERAEQTGYILVASEKLGSEALGFAHVLGVAGGNHLEQLSVTPSAMRRGYGRALVEAVKAESRHRGSKRVTLETYADVPWNAPFYMRCGFVEIAPDTDFLRELSAVEHERSHKYGRRIQMASDLSAEYCQREQPR